MASKRPRLWQLLLAILWQLVCPASSLQGTVQFNITRPLTVCTASTDNLGLRCNADQVFDFDREPAAHADQPGPGSDDQCAPGQNFCGHDVDVWRGAAGALGLVEGRDYVHKCLGPNGFAYIIQSLKGQNFTYGVCDIGVSGITDTAERRDAGITFSRSTYRAYLAVLVHAALEQRGTWTFFSPLHPLVWLMLMATVMVTPLIVFFFEAVFNKCTFYAEDGKLDVLKGLSECMWHSLSHTLSIDVFRVRSFSARIIVAAYAFLVLILTHTYTANLAAFLTVRVLDTNIRSVADLRGKAVATIPPYVARLQQNHHITASSADGWNYPEIMAKLKAGEYAAFISGDSQLVPRAYADDSCSLHILDEHVANFDTAVAFRRGFPSDAFREAVSGVLLEMQQNETLAEIKEKYAPSKPKCLEAATEFNETNRVGMSSVWGLWIIIGGAMAAAVVGGVGEYAWKRYRKHEDVDHMRHRLSMFLSISERRNRSRLQAAEAAVAAEGGAQPGAHRLTPFMHGPKGGGVAWAHRASDIGCRFHMPRMHEPDPASEPPPSGWPPSGPHSSLPPPARLHAYPHLVDELIDPTSSADHTTAHHSHCMYSALNASAVTRDSNISTTTLSMNSMAGRSGQTDCEAFPLPELTHIQSLWPDECASIELPPPPQRMPQHAQHTQREEGASAQEWRTEMAEVVSMLRMVTERVTELQRSRQVNV